jgi:CheY-like chemotaxis protein/ligand-binding sensor domain-containing protein
VYGVSDVTSDSFGHEWVMTKYGLWCHGMGLVSRLPFRYICQYGNKVFMATDNAQVSYYKKGVRQLQKVVIPAGIKKINAMVRLPKGLVAMATDNGIIIYNTVSGQLKVISIQSPSQPIAAVGNIFTDSRQRIWAFPDKGYGVVKVDPYTNSTSWLQSEKPNPSIGEECSNVFFHEDNNRNVWIIAHDGTFSYYDETKQQLVPFRLETNTNDNHPLPFITDYKADNQGNVWIRGLHNLTLLCFEQKMFHLTSINNNDTRSLCYDKDGNLLIGTITGNLLVFNKDGKQIAQHKVAESGLYTLFIDSKSRLWIGTKRSGAFMGTGSYQNMSFRNFMNNPNDPKSISSNSVYDIVEDHKHRILIGSYGDGLNIVDESQAGKIQFINMHNQLAPMSDACLRIRRIYLLDNGSVMLSTTGGLVTCSDTYSSPEKVRFHYSQHIDGDSTSLLSSEVLQVFKSKNGTIYVSSRGGGVQTLVSKNLLQNNLKFRKLPAYYKDQGTVQSILEDKCGDIWLVRENSINRYRPSTDDLDVYVMTDISNEIDFTEALPAYNSATNKVALGLLGGFITFNPDSIRRSSYCPKIVFDGILYRGEANVTPILGYKRLEISPDHRDFTILFAALDYTVSNRIKYAYRIKELSSDWTYTGLAHGATIDNLKAGKYTLVVKSTNADGEWMNNETELHFYIHPHVYETTWAKLLYFILAIIIILWIIRIYHRHNVERMKREMNEKNLKMFNQIAHEIRTPLTLIIGPVKEVIDKEPLSLTAQNYLQFVIKNAKKMMQLLDKIFDAKTINDYQEDTEMVSDDNTGRSFFTMKNTNMASVMDMANKEQKPKLLVVEDNDELRYYLVNALSNDYEVLAASNGKEGLALAGSKQPNIIITDIVMPEMDGMTMIRELKADSATSHIPVIVLTAKASMDYKLEGMREGIDDYITKPFNVDYLRMRVNYVISKQKELRQASEDSLTRKESVLKIDLPEMDSADNALMKQIMDFLNENVGNSALRVEDIAHATNLSLTALYGKMKSIVGMSPGDFMKQVRIEKAKEMIAKSDATFAEIAYNVGFADPKYFSRCFKSEVGMTPKEYRSKFRK